MIERLTIGERIGLVREAVRKWLYLSHYSHFARLRRFHDREAWGDTREIVSVYRDCHDEEPHIDPTTKQEFWSPECLDLRAALPVEEALRSHGQHVAVWLVQQAVPDAEALVQFLEYRRPDYAQRADHALTTASMYARAKQDENPRDIPAGKDILSLRRVGGIWHLQYRNEKGDFPVKGNQFIQWLAKLLARPNRNLTVVELLGDPENKLAADAALGGEDARDKEGDRKINTRLEEIDELSELGGSEQLEDERLYLIRQLEERRKRLEAPIARAYNNISTQKRNFIRNKLTSTMPQLAAHLTACIDQDSSSYTLSYRPPTGTGQWHVENPSA